MASAREMLARVRPVVQGVQVSAPFGRAELALEVLGEVLDAVPASVTPAAAGDFPGHAAHGAAAVASS
jgi:homocysteine S-methyltransferase